MFGKILFFGGVEVLLRKMWFVKSRWKYCGIFLLMFCKVIVVLKLRWKIKVGMFWMKIYDL